MAAAIIPIVATAISVIGPQIPSIVQFVESLFGHSSTSGQKTGAEKMQTAVALLQQALTALANAGKIPSGPVVDPSLPAGLAGAVQQTVNTMQESGLLGPPSATPITRPVAQSTAPSAPAGGRAITLTGTLYGA